MRCIDRELAHLPKGNESLKAYVHSLMLERDEQRLRAEEQQRRAEELHGENLRLQLELEWFRKWYYGPRADRLQSTDGLAQLLLNFAEVLDRKPVNADDLQHDVSPEEEILRVKRGKGRRNLANFDNLPVTTHVYELNAVERACPGCGVERKETEPTKAGRLNIFPPASSVSIMYARSMLARVARATETARRSRQPPSRRRQSTRAWRGQAC